MGEGDESQISDAASIEQLAIACQKAREGRGNAIALGLLREIEVRIDLSGCHCDELLSAHIVRPVTESLRQFQLLGPDGAVFA
ncbi:MAG: hypothetical protein AB7C98_04305 [Acidithiobacillus sp.]